MKIFKHVALSSLLLGVTLLSSTATGDAPAAFPGSPNRYFSPNLDGVKDRLPIPLQIKDDGFLTKWIVVLYKKTGDTFSPIRSYESTSEREIRQMTVGKFVTRIFSKKEKIKIPPFVEWDGVKILSAGSNAVSSRAEDGLYYFQITAMDESGNEAKSPYVPVVIDTVTPVISAQVVSPVFSPNGDGSKETLLIALTLKNFDAKDTVRLEFWDTGKNPSAKAVVSIPAASLQNSVTNLGWNGKDAGGKDLPEGSYDLRVSAFDYAGNSNALPVQGIRLVRTMEKLSVAVSSPVFSPDGGGFQDTVTISQTLSSRLGLESWSLQMAQKDAKENAGPRRTFGGKNDFSDLLLFDGKDDKGQPLPDGVYVLSLKAAFDSGNAPVAAPVELEIDTTAPKLDIKLAANNFIPIEGAEGRKTMEIAQKAESRTGDQFQAEIVDETGNVILTTNFSGNLPPVFVWNGKNQNNEMVPGKYRYILKGRDNVANQSKLETPIFELIGVKSEASVTPNLAAFSPGKGNGKDTITFKIDFSAKNLVTGQTLRLVDSKKNTVKTFSAKSFLGEWIWDGKNDAGAVTPDGVYFYNFDSELSTGEKPKVSGRYVILDTTPVAVTGIRSEKAFSPNGDGRVDEAGLSFAKTPSALADAQDKVTLVIKNKDGKIHRSQTWQGQVPSGFRWKGEDQATSPAPEGDYVWELLTEDSAGNKAVYPGERFTLVRKVEPGILALSQPTFSSSKKIEGKNEVVEMISSFSSTRFLTNAALVLEPADGQGVPIVLARLAPGTPHRFSGNDVSGKPVPDGRYHILLMGRYESGIESESLPKEFLVDSRGPEIRIVTTPEYFSPDKDGIDDELRIGIKVTDALGVAKNEMFLFRKVDKDAKGRAFNQSLSNYVASGNRAFKTWPMNAGEFDGIISWDGKGDAGASVESANDYVLFLRSEDKAGNVTIHAHPITVDVLVERLADGRLRIIINSITFGFDSAFLGEGSGKTLDRLITILGKFPDYRIHVVGHTDSRGDANYNKNLSAERAKSVFNYFVEKDIVRTRLTTEGKGAAELQISPEKTTDDFTTEDNYRKNRRVEFFLKKEEKK